MRNLALTTGGIREVGFLTKDLYNTCEKFKKQEIKDGDTETVLAYTRDDYDGIEKMFWCDGICQADYKAFGSVITFDTNYKVNAYNKPFVVIVGVNHHRNTVPLGVTLIANEKIDTYIWVLRQLLEAGGNVAPYIVVTDGDKYMATTIEEVFPHAHHRLCLWHLMRNIKGHTNRCFCSKIMKCVDGARTPSEFEQTWEDLMKAYDEVRDKKWAQDLYNDKEKWAEAFMVGQFYAVFCKELEFESRHIVTKVKEEKGHRDGSSTTYVLNDCVVKDCNYIVCYNDKLKQLGTHCQARSQGVAPPVIKRGGFVELLKKFMPRTYNVGDAATATDSYEVNEKPEKAWLHLVIEDDCVRHWNFAKFVFDSFVDAIKVFKSETNPTHWGGCTLLLMGIFCEYSLRMDYTNIWKYDLPRIRDWNDVNTKNLHELINKLKDGYFTRKMMGVIDKEKAIIVGKAPQPHVEMVERAFDRINDKIDRWGAAVNQMWRLIFNFLVDLTPGISEDDVGEGRRKKKRAKSEKEEDETSDYEDEKDSGTGDYADSDKEEDLGVVPDVEESTPKSLVAAEVEEPSLDVPADGAEEKPTPEAAADAADVNPTTNEGVPEDPTANLGNASELQPEGGSLTTKNKDHEADM
uniref:MULE transposase domain-containing protein n=1 Tax=Chenopodium quinoa TaxID=63459 RepID=A0A803MQV6_CHEQI